MTKSKLEDYKVIRAIGKGSFGQILLVEKDSEQFAMKKISKKQIIKVNKMHEPFIERQILLKFKQIAPECFVTLFETHSDNEYIYMILEFCEGGSLEPIIKQLSLLENSYEVIKRIIIKIVLILEVMHTKGVIHRDLKPSNFLLHKNGTVKLADFGTAFAQPEFFSEEIAKSIAEFRQMSKKKQSEKFDEQQSLSKSDPGVRRATFVGTPLYMAPQLLQEDFCGPEADLWALGCIIYELINLKPPFYDENEGMVWKKIINNDYQSIKIKENQSSQLLHYESLIQALLVTERLKRLGYGENGYKDIKEHPFFTNVNWEEERNKPIKELAVLFQKNKSLLEKQPVKTEQKIIFSGVVSKKMFFGNFKDRMLVLHSTPKLIYYDMETGEQKGQILLTKHTPVGTEGSKIFTITNQKKTYFFKSIKSHEWMEMIKYSIITAYY